MLFAVPLLGEHLDLPTLAFALAVVATVFVGRWMSVGTPATSPIAPLRRSRDAGVDASSRGPA